MNINHLEIESYTGIGKRKTAVAKVFLKEGSGNIIINKKPFSFFLQSVGEEGHSIKHPFLLVNALDSYDVDIVVSGGGISGQMDAIRLGLTRALCQKNKEYRIIFNQSFGLRRDSRIKERKKYGLKKARKASQYSKR